MKRFILVLLFFSACLVNAQDYWQINKPHSRSGQTNLNSTETFLTLDFEAFKKSILTNGYVWIPVQDDDFQKFALSEVQIMEAALADKYPSIRTFRGTNQYGESVAVDINDQAANILIHGHKGDIYIDARKNGLYSLYKASTYRRIKGKVLEETEPIISDTEFYSRVKRKAASQSYQIPTGDTLRTYRIAVAATGEYTDYHGGTVSGALAAMVTTLNRVNSIYERDLAIRMVLVGNNDQIIFTDAAEDGFSNNSAGAMLPQLQQTIDSLIGPSNYDIGHGFSTGAGGLAFLGAVCNDENKARGVTGLPVPEGDVFDVDFVSHEIGHQFGAPHTFNGNAGSCGANRTAASAFEPGSGSTIMGYAGICGSQNLQDFSDPYFHGGSLQFISAYVDAAGGSCSQISLSGNSIPIIEEFDSGFVVPINTPFELSASALDADSDQLSYCWEQVNLGPAGSPTSPEGNAPIFRSFPPISDSTRVFPQLADILSNTSTFGEQLPTYQRQLDFLLTVRDNAAIGGVTQALSTIEVVEQAGPFEVFQPDNFNLGASNISVNWDVANTNLSPINCQNVDIFFSEDGGNTFTLILENTPNDGQANITLPNITSTQCRIKIKGSDNIFFDINNDDFTVEEDNGPNYRLQYTFINDVICVNDDILISIKAIPINGYDQNVQLNVTDLNESLVSSFDNTTLGINDSIVLVIDNPDLLDGNFSFVVNSNSGSLSRSDTINFAVQLIELESPTFSSLRGLVQDAYPTIRWNDPNSELTKYEFLLSTTENFTDTVVYVESLEESSFDIDDPLEGNTVYHIQLITSYLCAIDTAQQKFTTGNFTSVVVENNENQNFTEEAFDTIVSIINIPYSGDFEEMKIKNIRGSHQYVGDLVFKLRNPLGQEIFLLQNRCGANQDYYISFDDLADNFSIECPLNDSTAYRPEEPLNNFAGSKVFGDWQLLIIDTQPDDIGTFEGWRLELIIREGILSQEAPLNEKIKVFPNPVKNELLVEGLNQSNQYRYKIMDKTGRQIIQGIIESGDLILDVQDLNQGLYILELSSALKGSKRFIRFVKK